MRNNLHPSPSEIVMTAILELKQDRGISLNDIVKYGKATYGLPVDRLKTGIRAALKRGVGYNLLYKKRGLYHLNKDVCKIPSGNEVGKKRSIDGTMKSNGKQTKAKPPSEDSGVSRQKRRKKKEVRHFLCPECRALAKAEQNGPGKAEEEKGQRYDFRPRKTPSQSSAKGSVTGVTNKDQSEVEKKSCRSSWKFSKMKFPFQSHRRNKDKK